ncbi:MAG: hypothetical protein HYW25_05715, partial [Candidatus Aenigmarchaeota archaeon]|nr:hypothetical protein [Candidatus Aenigmarchaeota archaeon]
GNSGGEPLLSRRSRPVIVGHPTGKRRAVQFQYTRFSPRNSQRFWDVYRKNRARHGNGRRNYVSHETLWKELEGEHQRWDGFAEVTDNQFFSNANVHRWEKEFYAAVYDIEGEIPDTGPFSVYEPVELDGQLPVVHITFHREPFFVINGCREDTDKLRDRLSIGFPQMSVEHSKHIAAARSLHPADSLTPQNSSPFSANYDVDPDIERKIPLGIIHSYLKHLLLGRTF